uniref:Cytosolic endo-beta-N-acetylglucosaminidase TIM barrel domain-containing protein n=1 Tax=Glossina austeni TaxID=7395 RepID=A0A1A9UDY2_GLOAU
MSDLSLQDQLEAEALHNNEQLLNFKVRSKHIDWHMYVKPLRPRYAKPIYLKKQFNLLSNYCEQIDDNNRRELLLCHDMMGNYLEDRHFNSSKKFDDYRFYHWSGVDYFCYFSHHYITIPPCGWINAAHKHGVRVLGTFITEGHIGDQLLHDVLASREMVNNIVNAMVKLCKHYGFEGWLVNIECKVNPNDMENLYYFLDRLHLAVEDQISHGIVLWYDSIIETGQLLWQNELNAKNVRFLKSSHGMLINYSWTDKSLEVTRALCERERAACQTVFFGIDIFGRGQIAKFHSKQTLARIAKQCFSVGIFAPAWTYETLQQYGYDIKHITGRNDVNEAFLQRNEKFWWSLWENLATYPYHHLPFYTDFCLGSGRQVYVRGKVNILNETPFFNLSRQSLQPSVPLHELATRCYEDAFNGGSCLRIEQHDRTFRLFATDFKLQYNGLVCAYAYKLQERDGEFDCILRFCTDNNAHDCYLFLGDYYDMFSLYKGRCYVSPFKAKENEELLKDSVACPEIPMSLSCDDLTSANNNGWRVRYYVVAFDGPVHIKDAGVLYRKSVDAKDTAYLGAFYLNEFDVNASNFSAASNFAYIPIYGKDLLN